MSQDSISFQQLYEQYAKDVYRFSFWLSGNADDAKDITSETFVKVWTSAPEIRSASVKAYLFTIARNIFLQTKRKKGLFSPLNDDAADEIILPDRNAEIRSELEVTLQAMQSLSEIDRTILIMRAQDELSYEEIAQATGLSLSSVKVKLFRAREKLYSQLTLQKGEQV